MKYEIINPSDKCYIFAEDERLAKIACALLGEGWYGLKDESGNSTMYIFEGAADALQMTDEEVTAFIDSNLTALAEVLNSITYPSERTSLNNIEAKAKRYAEAFLKKAGDNSAC